MNTSSQMSQALAGATFRAVSCKRCRVTFAVAVDDEDTAKALKVRHRKGGGWNHDILHRGQRLMFWGFNEHGLTNSCPMENDMLVRVARLEPLSNISVEGTQND